MATRGDIRDAFTAELKKLSGTYDVTDAAGNVIDSVTLEQSDISLREPEGPETLPAVVYHDDYRRVTYNGVGAGPDMIEYNDDGTVDAEVWREYIEAQFIIDVRASNETVKEPLYEAMRSRFGQYQYSPWSLDALHADATEIEVLDSSTIDTGDEEDVIRGDQLEVRITFHRDYRFSTDNLTSVDTSVDVDDDGTIDYTYTTT